jgi:hypothetical protein
MERIGASIEVSRFLHHDRQGPGEGSNPFGRQQRNDRIGVCADGGLVVKKRAHAPRTVSDRLREFRRVTMPFLPRDLCTPPIDPGTSPEINLLTSGSNPDASTA